MKQYIIILSLLIAAFFCRTTSGQACKIGLSVEPSLMFYEKGSESLIAFIPFSANLKILTTPLEWLNLETRPGIFIGGNDYIWLELGAFARINLLPTRFYLIAGLNDHIRGGYNDVFYNGAGIGFRKDSRLSIDLIYYWNNGSRDNGINGILKAAFSFTWDL